MHAALVLYAIMDARWKHPFTCIVAGPTGCGKSTFVTRMLRHAAAMIDPPPEQITWCYGEWQEAYATTDLGHVRFEEGLPTAAMFDSTTRNLIVIDDLMADSHYMVVFKNPRDASQMATLARQMYPRRGNFVQEAFKVGTVRLSIGRSQTGHARGHASAHGHLSRRLCSVRVLAEGIKE